MKSNWPIVTVGIFDAIAGIFTGNELLLVVASILLPIGFFWEGGKEK